MAMGNPPVGPFVMVMVAAVCSIGGANDLNAQRAHAAKHGISSEVIGTGRLSCSDRQNSEACLGTLSQSVGGTKGCVWGPDDSGANKCQAKVTDTDGSPTTCCLDNMCADDPALNAKCKTFRFKLTCTMWAEMNGAEACGEGETVSEWNGDDPTDIGSYRAWTGYNCAESTCDTREQCCYKAKGSDIPTCNTYKDSEGNVGPYPAEHCEFNGRILKTHLEAIQCHGGWGCDPKDCCDDTCAKSSSGEWYCPSSVGTLVEDPKTVRCATINKYDGIDCSDEQCCDPINSESKYSSGKNLFEASGRGWALPAAVAMCGVMTLGIAIAVRRSRVHDSEGVESAEELLEGRE